MPHIVILGAGQAGCSLATRLREKNFDGDITLVGNEPVPPYQRPPLSKGYLLGEMSRDRLFLKPRGFYDDHNVRLMLGDMAGDIDLAAKSVKVGDEVLHYDQLAITTGLVPRNLPDEIGRGLDGQFVVRALDDIDRLEPALRSAKRALVVGGGYIGLEAASVARKMGVAVTLVEAAPRILCRVAAAETSDYFRDLHQRNGVEILENLTVDHLIGDGHVTGAKLGNGEVLECDLVIVGIGLLPRCKIAEQAGLQVGGGVRVDRYGRTSDPDVWAAGDCAALPFRGDHIRLESVQNAIEMAERVAENMVGDLQEYAPHPWFWSDQYDVKLQIAGMNTGYDRIVVRAGDKPGAQSHWYYCGDELLAVDAMNDGRAYMVGKRMIEAGRSPNPDQVRDTDVALKALLAA